MISVNIDRSDPTLLHDQVAAEIRRAIAEGEAGPGDRLPLAKDIAAVLGVNKNTVLRAMHILRDEGLVEFGRGSGITVTGTVERGAVLRQVIGKGMGPTAVGIGLGLMGAVVISLWLRLELVGARALDPVSFLGATVLLAMVAAVACLIPALTATRIDPAIALRAE